MREGTGPCRLEEAFRQELFRLINQYLSFPEDATLGKIVRTLVTFQQVRVAVEELCQRTCVTVLPEAPAGQWNDSCVLTEIPQIVRAVRDLRTVPRAEQANPECSPNTELIPAWRSDKPKKVGRGVRATKRPSRDAGK
jgi:hypothetical protein